MSLPKSKPLSKSSKVVTSRQPKIVENQSAKKSPKSTNHVTEASDIQTRKSRVCVCVCLVCGGRLNSASEKMPCVFVSLAPFVSQAFVSVVRCLCHEVESRAGKIGGGAKAAASSNLPSKQSLSHQQRVRAELGCRKKSPKTSGDV